MHRSTPPTWALLSSSHTHQQAFDSTEHESSEMGQNISAVYTYKRAGSLNRQLHKASSTCHPHPLVRLSIIQSLSLGIIVLAVSKDQADNAYLRVSIRPSL